MMSFDDAAALAAPDASAHYPKPVTTNSAATPAMRAAIPSAIDGVAVGGLEVSRFHDVPAALGAHAKRRSGRALAAGALSRELRRRDGFGRDGFSIARRRLLANALAALVGLR